MDGHTLARSHAHTISFARRPLGASGLSRFYQNKSRSFCSLAEAEALVFSERGLGKKRRRECLSDHEDEGDERQEEKRLARTQSHSALAAVPPGRWVPLEPKSYGPLTTGDAIVPFKSAAYSDDEAMTDEETMTDVPPAAPDVFPSLSPSAQPESSPRARSPSTPESDSEGVAMPFDYVGMAARFDTATSTSSTAAAASSAESHVKVDRSGTAVGPGGGAGEGEGEGAGEGRYAAAGAGGGGAAGSREGGNAATNAMANGVTVFGLGWHPPPPSEGKLAFHGISAALLSAGRGARSSTMTTVPETKIL
eukprot:CAMPEP_0170140804 /NCGR_PEP_ID=MMETSP0033_2-20121228/6589_1 /TAXON_ID=195969 /ORGANISM="Dolichomastix tenuilepis, Strain CCMP3274" /LENGTH=307 /DNA_ID=CAMNT_0010377037 /DNA_START=248 /DNA_END=1171 /DNA_ORIENTATION=+